MFFRFAASLILVVLVSMVGIGLEKQTLEMKRAVSRQYFQKDLLLEMHARLRLRIQQLTAPSQMAAYEEAMKTAAPRLASRPSPVPYPSTPSSNNTDSSTIDDADVTVPRRASRLPLLRWEHPAGTGR